MILDSYHVFLETKNQHKQTKTNKQEPCNPGFSPNVNTMFFLLTAPWFLFSFCLFVLLFCLVRFVLVFLCLYLLLCQNYMIAFFKHLHSDMRPRLILISCPFLYLGLYNFVFIFFPC